MVYAMNRFLMFACHDLILFVLLLTPSQSFTFYTFSPIFLIVNTVGVYTFGDFSNETISVYYVRNVAFLGFVLLVTHTLQSRDLRRFYEKKKLVKKQE